jgi:predicted DCC family thiol-disulfide oxidoreductase YuxK
MTRPVERAPYSFRDDPDVPPFDDAAPVAVMDGACALCTAGARMIARFDRSGRVRISPTNTELGAALLRHYGLSADDPESWLFIVDGRAYASLDGIIRVGACARGPGWLLQPLRLVPRPLQDWLYRRIARNRYAMFGRSDICAIPDPALRARLLP